MFLGSFQDSGLIRYSYDFNNEIKLVPSTVCKSMLQFHSLLNENLKIYSNRILGINYTKVDKAISYRRILL